MDNITRNSEADTDSSIMDNIHFSWIMAAVGSALVGLSGILPLLLIPDQCDTSINTESPMLKVLLSFAVGALLGDVFLHLLPEAWHYAQKNLEDNEGHVSMRCGLWVLCGLLLFIIVEKIFAEPASAEEDDEEEEEEEIDAARHKKDDDAAVPQGPPMEIEDIDRMIRAEKAKREKELGLMHNGGAVLSDDDCDSDKIYENCLFNNNSNGPGGSCGVIGGQVVCGGVMSNGVLLRGRCLKGNRWIGRTIRETKALEKIKAKGVNKPAEKEKSKHIAGYLNLLANSIDNFTHGLAVGGSFLVSFRVGVLSTFAILVHEIPHEVADFAILLKSGFSRWEAAKAQLATATGGIIGAMTAVVFSGASTSVEAKTSWILPFTAGGFLHIALITVLPDLLKEEDLKQSIKQLTALILGIVIMGTLTALVD